MRIRRGWGLAAIGMTSALLAMPGTSVATGSQARGLVLSYFELDGTHGYTIEGGELREGAFPPTVSVTAHRGALRATYEVPGDLGSGIHAAFDSLGHVDVDFHRLKRSVDRPEKGCVWITETGVFRGEISFAGEGGYTAIDATSAPGQIIRLPQGFCGSSDDRRARSPYLSPLHATRLAARSRVPHGFVSFEAMALALAPEAVSFQALLRERLGVMTVSRSASASSARDTFSLARSRPPRAAAVHPGAPFEGSARFQDPAGAVPTWTGSLGVSMPGAPDVTLAGAGFSARICLNSTLLGRCKVALPPSTGGRGPRPQLSGSQSQAFWDARLSWSR